MASAMASAMESAIDLCLRLSWIYDCKMIELFVTKPWQHSPDGWIDTLSNMTHTELKELVSARPHHRCPDSLKDFCLRVAEGGTNSCVTAQWTESVRLTSEVKVGMGAKKRHEIGRMASLVHTLSKENECGVVGDIGCGLGYLGQTLASSYELDVLGFELKDSNCQGVRKPWSHSATPSSMITEQLKVDSTAQCTTVLRNAFQKFCVDKARRSLPDDLPVPSSNISAAQTETSCSPVEVDDSRVCLVGLHCCGDLTPSTLKQFSDIEQCRVLVCVGCCYHRLSMNGSAFQNFPLSERLRNVYEDLIRRRGISLNTLALRLACQETKARWLGKTEEEIEMHSRHVAYRGVIQHYCHRTGSQISKKHKKLVGLSAFSTFDVYAETLLGRIEGVGEDDADRVRQGLADSYKECQKYFPYIRWYNALQVMMQEVLELVILRDRRDYLVERGHRCQLVSIFDDKVSPRSVALVAFKS